MPLYEYRCATCSHEFALLVGMTAEKAKQQCPQCGGRKLTKLISRPARITKGEGSDELDDSSLPDDGDFGDGLGDDFDRDDLDDE